MIEWPIKETPIQTRPVSHAPAGDQPPCPWSTILHDTSKDGISQDSEGLKIGGAVRTARSGDLPFSRWRGQGMKRLRRGQEGGVLGRAGCM